MKSHPARFRHRGGLTKVEPAENTHIHTPNHSEAHGSHESRQAHDGGHSHEMHQAGGDRQSHDGPSEATHDHTAHHRMMIRDFRKRFYISLVLSVPVLILAPLIQDLLGFSFVFAGSAYVVFGISSFIYLYGGWPFLSGLVNELRQKNPGMMTLIGLAVSVAFIYSAAVTFGLEGTPFYWELVTLISIMLAGHWIEMRSVLSASSALEKLAQLMPNEAHRKTGQGFEDVPLSNITIGDILLIRPGEKVPSDGVVTDGRSYVDESMLTGESRPVRKETGEELIGGSVNGDGSLEMEVKNAGKDSYLSKVISLVREAQAAKSRTQALSDRAAFWLTLIALSAGIVTLAAWLLVGKGVQFAITRMATVMIITCPHALGLAIPLVVSVSTSKSAQNGLLIRNRTAFENARRISTVVFDKTGTLTNGTFEVVDIHVYDDQFQQTDVIRLAATLELHSEHPIGKSIVAKAESAGVVLDQAQNFEAVKGKGISGAVDGRTVQVVSQRFLAELGMSVPEGFDGRKGVTWAFLVVDGSLAGSLALSDTIRPESRLAIKQLQGRGIQCWMLTGDNRATAKAVSEELGMDGFFAEVLPDQKQQMIKRLQDDGEYVAMTGDGVNDSPALAQAQVGIAIGSGTDVAAATADIILVNSNPLDISALIFFGRATYRKMVQNLVWATGYNVFAIPLAAGVLASVGVLLSPEIGAILMSLSTVIVAINARLLRFRKDTVPMEGATL